MTQDAWPQRWFGRPGRATLALFVIGAAPLLLGTVPPLQDLPNHLASAFIAEHLADYPDLQVNGFLRSNALLALWLHLLGGPLGLVGAARLFVAATLLAMAAALAWLGFSLAGPERLPSVTLLAWPMVHGFFVPVGLLNFSVGIAGALGALALARLREREPSTARTVGLAALGMAAWYGHPFPITIATGLVGLEVLLSAPWRSWPRRLALAVGPFVPALLLSVVTAAVHALKPEARPPLIEAGIFYLSPWETVGQLWAHGPAGFSWLEATALLPAAVLAASAWRERARAVPYFRWPAMALLLVAFFALPASLSNWGLFNARMIPFLWAGLLVRAPAALPRAVSRGLAAAAVAYAAAMIVDYHRLERERQAFSAAIPHVAIGARLLPLVFEQHGSAPFTEHLKHDWGWYVLARKTTAPLLFAVERSYPLTYLRWEPPELLPPAVDLMAIANRSPGEVCGDHRREEDPECRRRFEERWRRFWAIAEPRFDHLLTWDEPPGFAGLVPPSFHRTFVQGPLVLYVKAPAGAVGTTQGRAP
jgi:hypothetical protein